MQKVNIAHVGNEHNYWLRSLNFYKSEIGILRGILTELAGKNSAPEVMAEVEHFENQFTVQVDNIDRLAHDIQVNLDALSEAAKNASAGYIDGGLAATHSTMGERFESEEKVLSEVIKSFRKFAEKWM